MNLRELFNQARDGTLPPDFDQWDIANNHGWTVAHEAAAAQHLPPDFDRWELANEDGYTVLDTHKNSQKVIDAYNVEGG